MDTLISYDAAIWLTLIEFVLIFIHLVSSHIFFLKYMERIEDYLSDIEMIGLHADYYGDTWLGRRMRESFITMILIMPGAFKKQEVIPPYKLQKLPGHFRFWIKFFFYSAIVLLSAMTVLYLRLKQGSV
ncbi:MULTISPECIES: hypothetical protein [Pseudomonas]|jgi:hypothetical protein|uniref:hypothetical protein n=1 Tax=Pseudomonas TaxID=286 RepID=UPI00177F0345|nr:MULTISPECIES: hypothetical protein [unclassified Pseudomonas]MBD8708357.1 hypothetical protein [Pseudomonas sp. CFBP 13711]MBD8713403.1 hypothetical protein [Pseudomonas sp. CFBP 13715]